MELGYTTYGMRGQDPFEALPRLRDIGYDAIELTVSEGWPTSHERLDRDDRRRLVDLVEELGLSQPHLMDLSVHPCTTGDAREETRARFDATCALARDLGDEEASPVVKTPITGEQPSWEESRERIREDLVELADIAGDHGVTFAIEPHVGTAFETPEKADWLMENTDHPHLKLALDISHFPRELFDVERAVRLCGPDTVTTHVKDTEVVDGEFRFALPGETDFDYTRYFQGLVDVGYTGPIIAEVSAQIWDTPGYDPWEAAEFCYGALREPIAAANRYIDAAGDRPRER